MTRIDIVGGVYRERCSFPEWNQIFGSAGRAAVALSAHVDTVVLHTFVSDGEVASVEANFGGFGVDVHSINRTQEIGFDYLHSLSTPEIWPEASKRSVASGHNIIAETVIYFGALEADSEVEAKFCVYDPQSPNDPKYFKETGSKADRLAIILNWSEARKLTNLFDEKDVVEKIFQEDEPEILIIKNGLHGAKYFSITESGHIPAYKSLTSFTIGSGDVFVAAFCLSWAVFGIDIKSATDFASKATSKYVSTMSLPIISTSAVNDEEWEAASVTGGKVYLAGPFRELGQRAMVNDARDRIHSLGMRVFSPVHDIGHGTAEEVVQKDLDAIRECDVIFAFLNGSSPGTVFEVGFARGIDKPVYCVAQNMRASDVKLPEGSHCNIYGDYVSALFNMAWRK